MSSVTKSGFSGQSKSGASKDSPSIVLAMAKMIAFFALGLIALYILV